MLKCAPATAPERACCRNLKLSYQRHSATARGCSSSGIVKRVRIIVYSECRSNVPTAFTGYSFHVVEAAIVFANEIIVCFLFPIHIGVHRVYHLFTTVIHNGEHAFQHCLQLCLPNCVLTHLPANNLRKACEIFSRLEFMVLALLLQ